MSMAEEIGEILDKHAHIYHFGADADHGFGPGYVDWVEVYEEVMADRNNGDARPSSGMKNTKNGG